MRGGGRPVASLTGVAAIVAVNDGRAALAVAVTDDLTARIDAQVEEDEEAEDPTDEEVQAYIDVGEEEGILEPAEGKLLQSIVDFGDRFARERFICSACWVKW